MNALRYIYLRATDQPLFKESARIVFVNVLDSVHNNIYPKNKVSNQKYSIWNFLPKTLYEQFCPFITRYFLLIGILQLWSDISPVSPFSTWIPLLVVVTLGTIKELSDDYFRWQRDQIVNQRHWSVVDYESSYDYQRTCTKSIQSQEISVGDIVLVKRDEPFPCDLLLLKTSPSNHSNNNNTFNFSDSIAFIETTNIDGEMELKRRQSKLEMQYTQEASVGTFQGVVECSPPNQKVNVFNGTMKIMGQSHPNNNDEEILDNDIRVSVSTDQFLPCGAVLRSTDWIYGIAIYTGNQTKLGMNKYRPRSKWTKSDQFINQLTQLVFVFQLIIMLVLGICGEIYRRRIGTHMFYLGYDPNTKEESFLRPIIIPLRFLLLHSIMIPISLKITLDICKIFYSMFINWDIHLFDSRRNFRCQVNNGSMAEDLGQVDVILTDKTGTLTQNVMVFKQCVVGNKTYGLPSLEAIHEDHEIISDVKSEEDSNLIHFMRAITCCHSVILLENGIYQSSSPDEEALVSGAASCDIKLLRNQFDSLDISVNERQEHYHILHRFPFSSERRRMTVIVKNTQNEEVWVYSKGADDVIFPRLLNDPESDSETDSMFFQIDNFSQKGFRTLCVACRYLDPEEYRQWNVMYRQACEAIYEHSRLVAEAVAVVESRLHLLGVAAVEDRLQPNVPETISTLKECGISFWMLTGDREETAVQVATAASIVSREPDAKIRYIREDDSIAISDTVYALIDEAEACHESQTDMSLVVSSRALDILLQEFPSLFRHLTSHCTGGVLCCRITPRQKAAVARLVRSSDRRQQGSKSSILDLCCGISGLFSWNNDNDGDLIASRDTDDGNDGILYGRYGYRRKHTTVLSIGDGGNDAHMLQESDIGVGICSQGEAWQAVRAADYVLGKFESLSRLLMVHGRLSYYRTSMITQISFYKSLLLACQQTLFSLFSMFSGASLFGAFPIMAYNTVFTSALPLIFIFDRDVSSATMLRVPMLYKIWQQDGFFNLASFLRWAGEALYQSAAVFIVTALAFGSHRTVLAHNGRPGDMEILSIASLTILMIVQCITILFEAKFVPWISFSFISGSFIVYLILMFMFSIFGNIWSVFGSMNLLIREPIFYLTCSLGVVIAILPIIAIKYYQIEYHPSFTDSLRQSEYWRKQNQRGIVNSMMYEPASGGQDDNSDWETASNLLLAMPEFQAHPMQASSAMTSTVTTPTRTSPRSEDSDL
eukprot:gb/GECH01009474.1/.p1 GENE.gb/GECH01009474.1/~~gb/GECH01009474.1/.p1  ORF type:complete len:1221 (+),score=224.06 gb/GECH01009474.1/:1-3663(+)